MLTKLLQLFVLFLLISSCKSDNKDAFIPLKFENKTITEKSEAGCDNSDLGCSRISLDLISIQGPEEVSHKIEEALEDHIINIVSTDKNPTAENLEELAKNFIADQQKTAEEFNEAIPWEALVNTSVYTQNENVLSIGVDATVFTGGAHGYRSLSFLNFDPKTGEQLSQEELFTPDFTAFAEKIFREKQEIPADENINSTGFLFEGDSFHLPLNIGFEQDSLLLVYNPYEIASYATGEIYLKISKEEAEEFLKFEKE